MKRVYLETVLLAIGMFGYIAGCLWLLGAYDHAVKVMLGLIK